MFDFDIEWWQWGLSQFFGFIALCLMFYSLQTKNKTRTLLATVGSNLTLAISTALLYNWVLFGVLLVACVRDLCYLALKKSRFKLFHPVSIIVLVIFLGLTTTAVLLTRSNWWFNWVLLCTSLFIVFGYWMRNIHWLRISRFVASIALIVNHVHFSNITGIALDTASLISIIIFYIIFFKRKRKCQDCDTLPKACECGT